jgi:LuxR family maltose regulon positive regulatory protein
MGKDSDEPWRQGGLLLPPETISNATWLVATKLRPPVVRDDVIRRPKLERAVAESVRSLPLTLLSAPAGYGKTTMLALLPRLVPEQPVAWVTLDTEDNDPVRFVSLLAAALQGIHPECGRSLPPMLMGGGSDSAVLKRAIGELINDVMKYDEPLTLVLDDLHLVTEPAAYVVLEYLLSHLPPQMHLAVGTRHDPPLRLARLAARRQVLELRRPDLGFSEVEARELLIKSLGIELSHADVEALQERTEGWPAGLCLLAGPLARMGSPSDRTEFMAALSHSERYALDFLAEEVLRDLPADVRWFLLQTSVLNEMTPSACAALTGRSDAADMLDSLYKKNLTIASLSTAEEGEPVYRHHALFSRLLARQLEREMPDEIPDLHRRAARLQSTPGRAIAHYLSAGAWDEAAKLMVQSSVPILTRGMYDTISNWYAKLPSEAQDASPKLKIVVARAEIHRGDFAAAETLLEQARQTFLAAGDASGEGDALTSQITMSYQNNDRARAAALIDRAIQLPLEPIGQMAVRLGRAWLRLAECDWDACRNYITEALAIPATTTDRRVDFIGMTYMSAPLASVPGCLAVTEKYCAEAAERAVPGTAWHLGADELGAWPLLWRGCVDEALKRAEAADALRQQLGGYPFMGTDTSVMLAALYLARGEREAALRATDTLLQRLEHAALGKRDFYLHAAGRSRALLGDLAAAHAVHQRLADLRDNGPLAQYLADHLAGLIALIEKRFGEASDALGPAAALEAKLPVARAGGSARLLQAMLLFERGDRGTALDLLDRVLAEWLQDGTPGYALLDGPAILPVLTFAAERGVAPARRVLGFFRRPVVPGPVQVNAKASLPEPLTQREVEVLRLIAAGRTNRQIGEELYIGEETVKSHVVHILRKLDVTSRTQAAVRARELGL